MIMYLSNNAATFGMGLMLGYVTVRYALQAKPRGDRR
jgi:hypothetical protein